MKKGFYIVCFAFGLSACASQAPLDDAYYYPDKSAPSYSNSQNVQNTPSNPNASSIEYLNVQDTTVTIRIKK